MRFEWDEWKNVANQHKHGISFDEARELFESGAEYLVLLDTAHFADEDRFIAIGPIRRGVVVVVWTEPHEEVIRIVSARKANRREIRTMQDR